MPGDNFWDIFFFSRSLKQTIAEQFNKRMTVFPLLFHFHLLAEEKRISRAWGLKKEKKKKNDFLFPLIISWLTMLNVQIAKAERQLLREKKNLQYLFLKHRNSAIVGIYTLNM